MFARLRQRKARFPFYKQLDSLDCGATCLRMIAKHYGRHYSLPTLRQRSHIDHQGASLQGLSGAAESIGLRTLAVSVPFEKLQRDAPLPCIAHWRQSHYIVVYRITARKVWVADPAYGLITYSRAEFMQGWCADKDPQNLKGILLLLQPTPTFYQYEDEPPNRQGFGLVLPYLWQYRRYLVQLTIGLGAATLLQLLLPFITQAVVDVGINTRNIGFVWLMLLAQMMLFLGKTTIEFIRSWLLLHISTRINLSLLSDFLIKLLRLPIGFFDSKTIGDLMQRIGDHHRIEQFLTNSSLNTLFSLLNLLVFGLILAIYYLPIFVVFALGTLLHIVWVVLFMQKRRELDFKRFDSQARNQSQLFQLITGIQEIKLHNYERQKRWEWERAQTVLFRVATQGLALEQYQQIGASFLNESKNILITFIAAKAVIDGQITLGMLLAISYIIGQLNAPVTQLIAFLQAAQDARISLERLGEIHGQPDEYLQQKHQTDILPEEGGLAFKGLSFRYGDSASPLVLKNINLHIPYQKVTAIVGSSGSGKTTLIKLLLKFYEPTQGNIQLGDMPLSNIDNQVWRACCGAVMQDGFIFSDTIAKNIVIADDDIDKHKLVLAAKAANIQTFIQSLPLGYNTKIGQEGVGLSGGQKQRMLIARAVYKNPDYLFFDEATAALDTENERVIMDNLQEFYRGKTVVVVAHRLSTVKNADQIVVLDNGEVTEIGKHDELVAQKGAYFNLIKNQLELGQ